MKKNQNKTISIIDYGVGNLYSITKACRKFSDSAVVTEDLKVIKSSAALILPGVGSFGAGAEGLKRRDLVGVIREFADSGRPILGICLGAQLLMSKGYEFGEFEGLGVVPGEVVKFGKLSAGAKIPHIGWNRIAADDGGLAPLEVASPRSHGLVPSARARLLTGQGTIFGSLGKNSHFYFVHSYIMKPEDPKNIFAVTDYGGESFCSVIRHGNIYGCQFHPEKSGPVGLKLINNFIKLVPTQ